MIQSPSVTDKDRYEAFFKETTPVERFNTVIELRIEINCFVEELSQIQGIHLIIPDPKLDGQTQVRFMAPYTLSITSFNKLISNPFSFGVRT